MNIEITDIIAIVSVCSTVIVAAIAALTPLIASHINAKQNLLMKDMESEYYQKFEAYKKFCAAFGGIEYHTGHDNAHDYTVALHEVLLLCSPNTRTELLKLNSLIVANDYFADESNKPQFLICCEALNKELKEIKASYKIGQSNKNSTDKNK